MSSFVNKLASSITNTTGSIIGRDNLNKLTNGLNKSLFVKSKYRYFMKHGNTIQLISRSSHMSLQICASQNDPNRLILLGNGQVGPNFLNSHFIIEVDPKSKNYKFKNYNNYVSYDNEVPCVLKDPINPKNNREALRARNEFRLHEILGSEEHFALESVYYPGRYLTILPDGSITSLRDKSDEKTHFCINVINELPQNMRPQSGASNISTYTSPVVPVSVGATSSNAYRESTNLTNNNLSKEEESMQYNQTVPEPAPSTSQPSDMPPAYSNLYPKLPN